MHRIIHTFKKILQLLFNRIFYVAVALMLQHCMVVDHLHGARQHIQNIFLM